MQLIEVRLVARFRFHSKMEGNHNSILYTAIHTQTNQTVFLKGEDSKSTTVKPSVLSILQEGKILQLMQGGVGIPHMHWCGQEDDYNFIVLEKMEADLASLLKSCHGKFSLKTSLMVCNELVSIFQYFHFKHFTYNNVHPAHITIGSGDKFDKIFIVDYSKCYRYRSANSLEHMPEIADQNQQLRHLNMEFSSRNYHQGKMPSRRDDLESMMYLLAYLLNGSLPWSAHCKNLHKKQLEKSKSVLDKKMNSSAKCLFEQFPSLQGLYQYTISLSYEQKPNYAYYKSVLSKILSQRNEIDDKVYDWFLIDSVDQPQLNPNFEAIEHQTQYLKHVQAQLTKEIPSQETNLIHRFQKEIFMAKDNIKNDKQCEIY